jgi:hypothetical protein
MLVARRLHHPHLQVHPTFTTVHCSLPYHLVATAASTGTLSSSPPSSSLPSPPLPFPRYRRLKWHAITHHHSRLRHCSLGPSPSPSLPQLARRLHHHHLHRCLCCLSLQGRLRRRLAGTPSSPPSSLPPSPPVTSGPSPPPSPRLACRLHHHHLHHCLCSLSLQGRLRRRLDWHAVFTTLFIAAFATGHFRALSTAVASTGMPSSPSPSSSLPLQPVPSGPSPPPPRLARRLHHPLYRRLRHRSLQGPLRQGLPQEKGLLGGDLLVVLYIHRGVNH